MISYSKSKLRRCRPLLGTFVDITASGLDADSLARAVNDAFAVFERVQHLMSVHEPASELSRVNAQAHRHPVPVSDETFAVLTHGLELARASSGAFDFTVAPTLARWGLLPAELRRTRPGDWRDVRLLPRRQVRFLRPLTIDLGGIAKGFAVDQAVEVLRARGVTAALVNAGGDLRVFGSTPSTIHLRHPACPQFCMPALKVSQTALATSSPCFTQRHWHGRAVSHLVNPRSHTAVSGKISVTVRAPKCWLADALTKVVLNTPETAGRILARYDAEAFVFTA